MTLAREWRYPYGLTMGEWFALTTWQKFRMFLWRLRYKRGRYCEFIRSRARSEFLHKSLKGQDFQYKCESAPDGSLCSCSGRTMCWREGQGGKGFCWCRCTPDGTLTQGYNDLVKYTRRETDQ